MLKLYDLPLSLNCYKVRLLLSLLGVDYEKEMVDLFQGEHKTDDFLAINPFGQIPILVDEGNVIRDSQAIMVWIARKYDGDAWMPNGIEEEALVNEWLSAAAYELRLGPYDARLAKHELAIMFCVNENKVDERSKTALTLYEGRLSDRQWIALDRPTIADVAAFPAISQCGDGEISLDPYPSVAAWVGRVRALPGFVDILD
ncbi:MAG: glutathione S-transferase family protein [Pseudomonadota bacterium]